MSFDGRSEFARAEALDTYDIGVEKGRELTLRMGGTERGKGCGSG
jgi:hypothetical protein